MSNGVIEIRDIDLATDTHLAVSAREKIGVGLLGASQFMARLFQLTSP